MASTDALASGSAAAPDDEKNKSDSSAKPESDKAGTTQTTAWGWIIAVGLLAILGAALFSWLTTTRSTPSMSINTLETIDISQCIGELNGEYAALLNKINLCYTKGERQLILLDSLIRRAKFKEQLDLDRVLLWMMIMITVSGVALSAVQLVASYRLAAAGRGQLPDTSEMLLERGKISLKSSVTGLFILLISLAFFVIFVLEIYKSDLNVIGAPVGSAQLFNIVPMPSTDAKPTR